MTPFIGVLVGLAIPLLAVGSVVAAVVIVRAVWRRGETVDAARARAARDVASNRPAVVLEQLPKLNPRTDLGAGHCGHAPQCVNVDPPDERDPMGCCNCGTRALERQSKGGGE